MIKKYDSFLILKIYESILDVDDKFEKVIRSIVYKYPLGSSERKIAKYILDLIGTDIKTNYNSISLGKSNNDVEFIPDSKYKKVSISNKSIIKLGRLVRSLVKDNGGEDFTDVDYEKFINAYKATYDKYIDSSKRNLEIVNGENIYHWYLDDNYKYPGQGVLGNSCMSYSYRNKFMEIYVKNPEVCSLVILTEGGKLIGRALLWKLNNGKYYLDRVYTRFDSDVQVIKEFAIEKHGNNLIFGDDIYNANTHVDLKVTECDNYPYLDTFCYLVINLDDERRPNNTGQLRYDNPYGEINNNGKLKQVSFGVTSTGGGRQLYDKYKMVDNKYYLISELKYVSKYNKYLPSDDCIEDVNGRGQLKSDCVYSDHLKGYILKEESIEHDDKIYDLRKVYIQIDNIDENYLDPIKLKYSIINKEVKFEDVVEYKIIYDSNIDRTKYTITDHPYWFNIEGLNTCDIYISDKYISNDYYNLLRYYKVYRVGGLALTELDMKLFYPNIDLKSVENSFYEDCDRYISRYSDELDPYLMLDALNKLPASKDKDIKIDQLKYIFGILSNNIKRGILTKSEYESNLNTLVEFYQYDDEFTKRIANNLFRKIDVSKIEYFNENLKKIIESVLTYSVAVLRGTGSINTNVARELNVDIEMLDCFEDLFYNKYKYTTDSLLYDKIYDILDNNDMKRYLNNKFLIDIIKN